MSKITFLVLGSLICLLGTHSVVAQDKLLGQGNTRPYVQKYTVMEQFEPKMVLSVAERIRLKNQRKAAIERRRGILDTLDISEKRRQRLIRALRKNPFSDKMNRAVAEIEFMEDEAEN